MKNLNMKNIICILSFTLIVFGFGLTSCNGFLEKPPTNDVVIEDIFNNRELADNAMTMCYINLPFGLPAKQAQNDAQIPYSAVGKGVLDNLTDLTANGQPQVNAVNNYYYPGLYNSTLEQNSPQWVKYSYSKAGQWDAIRRCWILINNIDNVPESEMTATEKARYKAEARVIIAIHYLEMLRHLGGVPKVDHVYEANENLDTERMTITEMIDWIEELIDSSIGDLPPYYSDPNMYGHITRIGALAVKARMLLFVASPLYNDTQPYMEGEAADKKYVWLGGKDNNLWKRAMDACDQVINEALASGYGLVQPVTQDLAGYRAAYRIAYRTPDNGELLIVTRAPNAPTYVASFADATNEFFQQCYNQGSFSPTQNWADMFPMTNGYDIDPSMPNYNSANGYDNQLPYLNRDPRFYESITTNNDEWGKGSPGKARCWIGNPDDTNRFFFLGCQMRKFHLGGTAANVMSIGDPLVWPYIRLAEIYLSYAEAANQYEGGPSKLALDRVNEVRARVGLPGLPEGMSKDAFHKAVMKERCCELGFESVRWFDIIRWKMDDCFKVTLRGVKSWIWVKNPDLLSKPGIKVQQGTRANNYGADIPGYADTDHVYLVGDGVIGDNGVIYQRLPWGISGDDDFVPSSVVFDPTKHILTYKYYNASDVYPELTRVWATNFSPKWYLSAFPVGEVNKGYGLVQNSGW